MSISGSRGTRGAKQPNGRLMRWVNSQMIRRLRRNGGGRMRDFNALVLTTVGRKSGLERTTPVGWFPDGADSWLIVASANGALDNPAWFYNIAANPDKVRIEVLGESVDVTAEQLHGSDRETAWNRIIESAPSFARYETTTDRAIPILKLTRRQPDQ